MDVYFLIGDEDVGKLPESIFVYQL